MVTISLREDELMFLSYNFLTFKLSKYQAEVVKGIYEKFISTTGKRSLKIQIKRDMEELISSYKLDTKIYKKGA